MLSIVYGINAANSNYPCIWCTSHKNDFGKTNKNLSISDSNLKARKLLDSKRIITQKEEGFGYKKLPLTNSIEFDHTTIDTLHLLLRISDTLLELFLKTYLLRINLIALIFQVAKTFQSF